MADTKVTLKVLLESAGIKPTEKQLKKLSDQMQETAGKSKNLSKEQNKLKRNLEGVSQRSGRQGKDFSRLQQGMGGLVQAYATVAANVFALSSAFLVLRRAADLSSQLKSAQDFSERFGVNVRTITQRVQEATGGALSLAEALPSVNKAVSAGLGIEQIEQLSIAATKASQTFGGTATEALNRFISASQRGRVEIIQTLGVVIKTEQAYADYAASIGKTAQELTAYDRQQAIVNATIEEAGKVFDGVNIDPNPFQQLLTTLTDIKNSILTFFTDALTPVLNFFNKSQAAGVALIAILARIVGAKFIPTLAEDIQAASKAGLASTKAARKALVDAKRKEAGLILEIEQNVSRLTDKELRKRSQLFKKFYADSLSQSKGYGAELIDQEGKINEAILRERRRLIATEQAARARGRGQQKAFIGVSDRALANEANRLTLIAKGLGTVAVKQEKVATATSAANERLRVFFAQAQTGFTKLSTQITQASSAFKTGFAQGFRVAEGQVVQSIKRMNVAWLVFIRDLNSGAAKANSALVNFSKAFGRTVGVVSGLIGKLLSFAVTISVVVAGLTIAWDLFGKKLFGISEQQQKVKAAFDDLGQSLKEVNELTLNYIDTTDLSINSTARLIKSFEFLRGTLDSTLTAFRDFRSGLVEVLGSTGLRVASIELTAIANQIDELTARRDEIRAFRQAIVAGEVERPDQAVLTELTKETSEINRNLIAARNAGVDLVSVARDLAEEASPEIVKNFATLAQLFRAEQFTFFDKQVIADLRTELRGLTDEADNLVDALLAGDIDAFNEALDDVENRGKLLGILEAIISGIEGAGSTALTAAAQLNAATRALQDIDQRVGNFVSGIDKLRAASVPNKEIFNFLLDIERQLGILQTQANEVGAQQRIRDFITQGDLDNFRAFVDIAEDATIEEVLQAFGEARQVFQRVIEDSITSTNRLKIEQEKLKQQALEIVRSDERRLELIDERLQVQRNIKTLELSIAQNSQAAAQAELDLLEKQGEGESFRAQILRAQISLLQQEVITRQRSLDLLDENVEREQQLAVIRQANLSAIRSGTDALLRAARLRQTISRTEREDLMIREEIFSLEQDSLELQKAQIRQQIEDLQYTETNANEQERKRIQLEGQLLVLEEQTRQLERQQLLLEAAQAEQGATSIFDSEGLALAAKFFVQKIRDEARNLKTTFQILGEGFVTAFNNTFDSAVDNLLEGGKDFGQVVIETLKAGLRETFGEALKSRIREAFSQLFENGENAEEEARRRAEEQKTNTVNLINALKANTAALQGKTASIAGQATGAATGAAGAITSLPSVFNQGGAGQGDNKVTGILESISAATGESAGWGAVAGTLLGIGNETAEGAKEAAAGQSQGLISILITLFGQLISAIFSAESIPFAMGGVIKGGTGPITPLANGGVVTGPSLALMGEGENNEAVVPLPNDREIPVDLRNEGGDTVYINQSFDFSNAGPDTVAQLRTESRNIEERTFNRVFAEINKGGRYAKISGRR